MKTLRTLKPLKTTETTALQAKATKVTKNNKVELNNSLAFLSACLTVGRFLSVLSGSKKVLSGPGGSKKTFVVKKLKFYHEQ